MLLPTEAHATRLRAHFTAFLCEAYLCANSEQLETVVQDAVLMKIHLTAVGRFDEAIPFFGKKPDDAAVRWRLVRLHVATMTPCVVLESPPYNIERLMYRPAKILVDAIRLGALGQFLETESLPRRMQTRLVIHDRFPSR